MRIKSYFAPSVQAAIALARKEFGDDVTLVTSHVASLDNRHLGEYEVVFAIEETIAQEPVVDAPAPVFNQFLQQAIEKPSAPDKDSVTRLEEIHSSLVALGLEASLVRSFMTMLKALLPTEVALVPPAPESSLPAEEPIVNLPVVAAAVLEEEPAPAKPKITVLKPRPAAAPTPAPRRFLSLFETARPEQPTQSQSQFSAAELAFMSSVSSPTEEKA